MTGRRSHEHRLALASENLEPSALPRRSCSEIAASCWNLRPCRKCSVRIIVASILVSLLPLVAWAETCEIDADCTPGNVCQKDPRASPNRPGLCQHDPRVPRTLFVPPGVAVPRSDRDPSTRVPTTSRNPTGYLQCTIDRDCPDGYACTRRSTSESWYCRKR
jgi:hypothetical protein